MRPSRDLGLAGAAAAVLLAAAAMALGAPAGPSPLGPEAASAAPGEAPAPRSADRADAAVIKDAARDILSQPRFTQRSSFWEWLLEKLGDWSPPDFQLAWSPGWGALLMWFIVIWCVLTLLAILAHFAWTILTMLRGRGPGGGAAGSRLPRFAQLMACSPEELDALQSRLAAEGAFREAVGVMMVALLRRMEALHVLRFHESKTNGDYVREFDAGRQGRDAFRTFVNAFDGTVYRGMPCGAESYARMGALYEACLAHVR